MATGIRSDLLLLLPPLVAVGLRLGLGDVGVGVVLVTYQDLLLLPAWALLLRRVRPHPGAGAPPHPLPASASAGAGQGRILTFFHGLTARGPGLLPLVALPLCLWQLLGLVPDAVSRTAPSTCEPTLSVVSANLLMVHPEPSRLASELRAFDADIYLLQEYSSRWDAELRGLRPHRFVNVQDDSFGTAIYSRYPLSAAQTIELGAVYQATAVVQSPLGPIELLDAHTLPPRSLSYIPLHLQGLRDIEGWVQTAAGDFIVAGDWNASPRAATFRRMREVATDVWSQAGQGPGYTWPNGVFPLPPARLDHVLVSNELAARRVHVGVGEGSDHRPIFVEIGRRCAGGGGV